MVDAEDTEEENRLGEVQEDLLRALSERGGEAFLESLKAEIQSSFFDSAVEKLQDRNLVQTEGKKLKITETGEERSKDVLRKHLAVERHFEKSRSKEEAHKAAHFLEHQISSDVIERIEKVSSLRDKGTPITKLGSNQGLITSILLEGKIFERVVSMGMCPGRKVRIHNDLPNAIVVEIDGKKLALEKGIAKQIEFVAQ